jgi:polyisoprenyl-teichoic acid--peptidoglycan teichoic acid transferase
MIKMREVKTPLRVIGIRYFMDESGQYYKKFGGNHRKQVKPFWQRKWLMISSIIGLLLFVSVGAFVFSVYRSLTNAVDTMQEPVNRESRPIVLDKREPFSILMLGVDERAGDAGRSDTIIVLTVNPQKDSVKMLSIPRDMRTEIVGKGIEDKINHAYAFGRVEMSMDTVEKFLDIPIDYYVKANMEGFRDIVDAVGGIKVNNNMEFSSGKSHFAVGEVNLTGEEALAYVRMRKEDPDGDYGRQRRQRQVIQGITNKAASLGSITKLDDIFTALSENVKTNITFNEMVDIQKNYKSAAKNVEQLSLQNVSKGTKIDGIYYLTISEEEKQNVQGILREHLKVPQ